MLHSFGGSGTTYAIAERLHRHSTGIEFGDCEPITRRLEGEDIVVALPGLERRRQGHQGSQLEQRAAGGSLHDPAHPARCPVVLDGDHARIAASGTD